MWIVCNYVCELSEMSCEKLAMSCTRSDFIWKLLRIMNVLHVVSIAYAKSDFIPNNELFNRTCLF